MFYRSAQMLARDMLVHFFFPFRLVSCSVVKARTFGKGRRKSGGVHTSKAGLVVRLGESHPGSEGRTTLGFLVGRFNPPQGSIRGPTPTWSVFWRKRMSRLGRMSVFPEEHLWGSASFGTSQAVKPKDIKNERKLELVIERQGAEVDRLRKLLEVAGPPTALNASTSNLEARRLKGKIAQQQRQMEIMDEELRTSNKRVAQYETLLDEVCTRVGNLEVQTQTPHSGAGGTGDLSRWLQEIATSLKKRKGSHHAEASWEHVENISFGGNKIIQGMSTTKPASVLDTCDGSLLTSPSARRHIHRLHEKLMHLVPQASRHSAWLQSVLLPALPWMGVDVSDQIACDAESLAAGLEEVLRSASDIAAVTPAQGLCLGKASLDGLASPCSFLDAARPEVKEIVAKLGLCVEESDVKNAEEILGHALHRYQLGYESMVARVDRMQLDLKSLGQISEAATKYHLRVQTLCTDMKSLCLGCKPEVLLALEGLKEIVQVAEELVELPSEALVRRLVDVILRNMEDFRKVPGVLKSSAVSVHKVLLKKLEGLSGEFEVED
ncbi:hypothetical protein BSKO_09520 [Bryopsis sp. KO-2023]|nr:hypothetical protein BSKO_09520 [Bryopsis sp. KO-2023]